MASTGERDTSASSDVPSSPRSSKRNKEDRDSKAKERTRRARDQPAVAPGAVPSSNFKERKKERSSGKLSADVDKSDRNPRLSSKPGAVPSTGRDDRKSSRHNDKSDRSSRSTSKAGAMPSTGRDDRRSSRSDKSARSSRSSSKPGAMPSTGRDDRKNSKSGRSHYSSNASSGSPNRTSRPISEEKKNLMANTASSAPAVVPSAKDKESDIDIVAMTVDDDSEMQALRDESAQRNREVEALRAELQRRDQEQQETSRARNNEELVSEEPRPQPFWRKKVCWLILAVILIGGIAAAVATLTGGGVANVDTPEATSDPTAQATTLAPEGNDTAANSPSSSPSASTTYDPPSEQDCIDIANNRTLAGQVGGERKDFSIRFDATLPVVWDFGDREVQELLDALERLLVPEIVGCSELDIGRRRLSSIQQQRRRLSSRYVIGNADVTVIENTDSNGLCVRANTAESEKCHVVEVGVAVYLKGAASDFEIIALISNVAIGNLVPTLELSDSFSEVYLSSAGPSNRSTPAPTTLQTQIQTPAPTMSSMPDGSTAPPTPLPAAGPTQAPTPLPTLAPVVGPSPPPTISPTLQPTSGPTAQPTPIPTPSPTGAPVVDPTSPPTRAPTLAPSSTPSELPTPVLSSTPSSLPSKSPTSRPTSAPTKESSAMPSALPSFQPSTLPTPAPSSNPSFLPFSGKQVENSHYVLYWPDPGVNGENPYLYLSTASAEAACNNIGLDLCPQNAIEGVHLCKAGYFSDGRGYWLEYDWCGGVQGFNGWFANDAGAYCCGRPHFMPDERPVSVSSYVYQSREEAADACATKGLQLCSTDQITGYDLCAYGWLKDTRGYYMSNGSSFGGCGADGLTILENGSPAGAYCCQGY